MTRDIDFVTHLEAKNRDLFADSFKEGFYCDKDGIKGRKWPTLEKLFM
jgi:hypothetical protein